MRTALDLTWRRSQIFYLVWAFSLMLLMPATLSKYRQLVPEGEQGGAMVKELAANSAMRAMLGPPFDLATAGGFTMWRVGTFTAAALAMMAALGVIRGTRGEEEAGRLELLRSGAIRRHAPLAAAITIACLISALVGALSAGGMIVGAAPVSGSIAAGAGIALTGAMWAGVGAVCAQLFPSARAAKAWALGGALGGLYLLRAAIDASPDSVTTERLRWAVPLEWAALVRPYAGERWWVLALPAALTLVLVLTAFTLESRRDLGSGLLASRPGPASGPRWLDGAQGLAWQLQRPSVIGWTVGILVSAVVLRSLAGTVGQLSNDNTRVGDMLRSMGGTEVLQDAFFTAMLGIMASLLGLAAVQLLSRLRTEEISGRVEPVLATATSRASYAAAQLWWALAVPAALLLNAGAVMGDQLIGAALLLPGIALVAGLAMLLLGWAPRLFWVAWALIGWSVFCTWIAAIFELPSWLTRAHPWGYLPHLPAESINWTPVVAESALALVLLAAGLMGYARRDIPR